MKVILKYFLILLSAFLIQLNGLQAQKDFSPRKSENGKYGYVDKSESFILSAKYDKAFSFTEQMARVIVRGKWGLIDRQGGYILKPKLTYIGWSNDGYFKWNKKNLSLTNTLIPAENTFFPDYNGVFGYLKNEKWGLLSSSGRLQKNEWDSLYFGEGGHFGVYKVDLGWTWIDENNKSQDDKYFFKVKPLSNGLIAAVENRGEAFKIYNFEGMLLSNNTYPEVASLNTKYIKARNGNLWNQLNTNAEIVEGQSFEEIKYVPWNNTMQYLPYSPWVQSDINFNTISELDFFIQYKVLDRVFVIMENDKKYIWRSDINKRIALSLNDTVSYNSGFIQLGNKKDKYSKLLTDKLDSIADDLLNFKYLKQQELLLINTQSDKWTLWDLKSNSEIISNIDSSINFLSLNEYILERNGNKGLYNIKEGKWILDSFYKSILRINDSVLVSVDTDSIYFHYGNGIKKAALSGSEIKRINDSLFAIKTQSNNWSIRHINFNKLILDEFSDVALTGSDAIRLKKKKGWLLYSITQNKFILSSSYDSISYIQLGFYLIQNANKWGIVNQKGNFTFQMSNYYKHILYFNEKRWQVYRNGLSGIIDQNGILKISTQYEDFETEKFGFIPFKFRSKWGLLDKKERFVLQPLNDKLEFINKDLIQVWKNKLTGIKDVKDKTLIPIEYESIEITEFDAFIVKSEDKYGFYNPSAQQIRPTSYDAIKQLNANLIALKKNGYWQVIDLKGALVNDKKFSEIFVDSGNLYFKEKKTWVMKSLD